MKTPFEKLYHEERMAWYKRYDKYAENLEAEGVEPRSFGSWIGGFGFK